MVLADFSIEKDLVFARLTLTQNEFEVFRNVYDFAIDSVGTQDLVIFLDIPIEVLIERIRLRGRPHEVNVDPVYFRDYFGQLKSYFKNESRTQALVTDGHDLELAPFNRQIKAIVREIRRTIKLAH